CATTWSSGSMTRASAWTMNAARPMMRSDARSRPAAAVSVIVWDDTLSGNPLREEDRVAVGILEAELAPAVELGLELHEHARARTDRRAHRVHARGGSLGLEDDEDRVEAADRPRPQFGVVGAHGFEAVQEHVHVVALHPRERERSRLGDSRD